jgi:hypothetical protein
MDQPRFGARLMNQPISEPRRSEFLRSHARLVALGSALLATALFLRASQWTGRLAQELTFDDVGYAIDAAHRLAVIHDGGVYALWHGLLVDPPHSPFSTALAMLGFAVGGIDDFALYAANGLVLLAVVGFLLRVTGRRDPALALLVVLTLLTSQLAFRIIHDFRPDIPAGLCAAAMVWWFAAGVVERNLGLVMRAGVAFGALFWIKPSFFAHALAIGFFVALLGAAWIWLRDRGSTFQPRSYRAPVSFLAIGIAVAAPYFVLAGPSIWDYFWSNTHGTAAAIWGFTPDAPLASVVRWYLLDRHATFRVLGDHFYLSLVGLSIAIPALVRNRQRDELVKVGALLATAAASTTVIVAGRHKNEFFLASAQSMLMLAALVASAHCIEPMRGRRRITWVCTWLVLLAVAVLGSRGLHPWTVDDETRTGVAWNGRIVNTIVSAEAGVAPRAPGDPIMVFVGFAGPVSGVSIEWEALKAAVPMDVKELYLSASLADYVAGARAADYVVIANENSNFYRKLPSGALEPDLARWIDESPAFAPVARAATDHYVVFRNLARLQNRPNKD